MQLSAKWWGAQACSGPILGMQQLCSCSLLMIQSTLSCARFLQHYRLVVGPTSTPSSQHFCHPSGGVSTVFMDSFTHDSVVFLQAVYSCSQISSQSAMCKYPSHAVWTPWGHCLKHGLPLYSLHNGSAKSPNGFLHISVMRGKHCS